MDWLIQFFITDGKLSNNGDVFFSWLLTYLVIIMAVSALDADEDLFPPLFISVIGIVISSLMMALYAAMRSDGFFVLPYVVVLTLSIAVGGVFSHQLKKIIRKR